MMKRLISFIALLLFSFCICNHVKAATWPTQCIYQGVYSNGIGWTTATVDSKGNAKFSKIDYYRETHKLGKQLVKLKSATSKTIEIANYNATAEIKYTNTSTIKVETLKVDSQYRLSKDIDTCPEYMILVNTEDLYVLLGDESLKSYLESNIDTSTSSEGKRYAIITYGTLISAANLLDSNSDGSTESTGSTDTADYGEATCDGMLGEYNSTTGEYAEDTVGWMLQKIFDYMKIAAIILIIAFTAKDYAMAIIDQEEQKFKIANVNLLKRIVIGIIVFLLPTLVNLIVGIVDSSTCGIR